MVEECGGTERTGLQAAYAESYLQAICDWSKLLVILDTACSLRWKCAESCRGKAGEVLGVFVLLVTNWVSWVDKPQFSRRSWVTRTTRILSSMFYGARVLDYWLRLFMGVLYCYKVMNVLGFIDVGALIAWFHGSWLVWCTMLSVKYLGGFWLFSTL